MTRAAAILAVVLAVVAVADDRLPGQWRANVAGETLELRLDPNGKGRFDGQDCGWSAAGSTLKLTYAAGHAEEFAYQYVDGKLVLALRFGRLPFRRVGGGDPRLVGTWETTVDRQTVRLRLAADGRAELLGRGGTWYSNDRQLFLDLADGPEAYRCEALGDDLTLIEVRTGARLRFLREHPVTAPVVLAPPPAAPAPPPLPAPTPGDPVIARNAAPAPLPLGAGQPTELVAQWLYLDLRDEDGALRTISRHLTLTADGRFVAGDRFGATYAAAAPDARGAWGVLDSRLLLRYDDGTGADLDYILTADALLLRQAATETRWSRLDTPR